jgi:hypothetical protein
VARRAELGGLVERLEKGGFMESRFRLHHEPVHGLQPAVVAESKWIMNGFLDGVIGVALGAVHVRDRVAHGAGDAGLRGRMFLDIKLWIVECAAEEWHRIVASAHQRDAFTLPSRLSATSRVSFTLKRYGLLLKELKWCAL